MKKMINVPLKQEEMSEFLVLSEIFKTTEEISKGMKDTYGRMYDRYKLLRDIFINHYKLPIES